MQGFFKLMAAALILPLPAVAGNQFSHPDGEKDSVERIDSVVVSSTRADRRTPVTYTMVSREEIRVSNPSNSLPMILGSQPSVVSTNEGGTGLGYSKLMVRGVKGSQINVTLDGVTLNDAESQEVFWVNIPSLQNILTSVQLQRGLGTSANGPGAFGASINMNTAFVPDRPFANVEVGAGSWNTMMTSVSAGSGLLPSGIYFSGAYSRNYTDGYVDHGTANVQSALAVLGWKNRTNSLRLTCLMGDQTSGLTWTGVPFSMYETDRRYNPEGLYTDSFGNSRRYDNHTDNYTQHHLNLNYTHSFSESLSWSTTLHWTKGDGYYEQYKSGKSFSDYGFADSYEKDGVAYRKSDFVIRKLMDNDNEVLNSDLRYSSDKFKLTSGVSLSRYNGGHFGKTIWSKVLGDGFDYDSIKWYENTGLKREASVYSRAEYQPVEWLTAYADLQYRAVSLKMWGPDDNFVSLAYRHTWNFFNPRIGVTFSWRPEHKAYLSAAIGHREPGRSDLKENIESVWTERELGNKDAEVSLKPERMLDIEAGYQYDGEKFSAGANIYAMEYWNMLIESGKLSVSGYAIKENVDRSWRRGVELWGSWRPSSVISLSANLTFSTNRIRNFVSYLDEYDNPDDWNPMPQSEHHLGTTDILMSPSLVGAFKVSANPFATVADNGWKSLGLSLDGKYVGEQYWDNTSSEDRKVPRYFVMNLSLFREFKVGSGKIGVGAYVNNLLNSRYFADAWVYRAHFQSDDSYYQEDGVFAQPLRNFMFKIWYRF